jgi:hypothetical protein
MFTIEQRIITGTEIASLEEAKTYFRSEESGGIEDNLILDLVSTARSVIEKLIDRSLIESTVTIFAEEWKGYLPFAPIDVDSIEVTGKPIIKGIKYPILETASECTVSYDTQRYFTSDLKSAVLELAFYWYERGEFTGGEVPEKIKKVTRIHSRLNFIA